MRTIATQLAVCAALALLVNAAHAQNQQEMNQQAARDFEAADNSLNRVYKQLIGALDKESQEKLKAVQRAWVVFRDSDAEFEMDLEARGGSMAPLIYHGRRTVLTKARIKELQRVLKENGH